MACGCFPGECRGIKGRSEMQTAMTFRSDGRSCLDAYNFCYSRPTRQHSPRSVVICSVVAFRLIFCCYIVYKAVDRAHKPLVADPPAVSHHLFRLRFLFSAACRIPKLSTRSIPPSKPLPPRPPSAEIGNYHYGQGHPMKPHRVRMTHNLVVNYGLYRNLEVYRPKLVSHTNLTRFHSDDYVNFLRTITPDNMTEFSRQLARCGWKGSRSEVKVEAP